MKDYLILNPALDSLSNEHTLALFVGKDRSISLMDFCPISRSVC